MGNGGSSGPRNPRGHSLLKGKSSQTVKMGNLYSGSTTSTNKKMRKTQQDELLHRWPSNTPKSPLMEKAPNWENIFETHITNK